MVEKDELVGSYKITNFASVGILEVHLNLPCLHFLVQGQSNARQKLTLQIPGRGIYSA